MTTPIAVENGAALDQLGRALAAVLASAAERIATTATAASSRPLGTGDQIQTHDDRVSALQERDAAAAKGDRHDALISTAD
jgi:hypothetical protein